MFRNPTTDLLVVLLIVLLIWGPKRLPGLGKQLGTGLREFRDSITGDSKDEDEDEGQSGRPALPQSTSVPVQPAAGGASPAPVQRSVPGAAAPGRESAEVGSDRSS
jgi:sec-independent protein translocase protein TatA